MKYIERDEEEFFKVMFLKKYLIGTNGIVAGGCFKNIFNNQHVKDIDMFFRTESDFKFANERYENDEEFELYYKNKNVIAYKEIKTGIVVELIKKIFGDPSDILDQFDFSITKFCYYYEVDYDTEETAMYNYYILHHPKFFEHLHEKKLVLDDSDLPYPFSTFERSYRYNSYGYRLCKESKINLITAIRNASKFEDNDLSKSLYNGLD